tara:strand:+ start:823 stop:1332 length:510 start_codon:yes stop_codon:yes gene_type:complete
MSSLSNIIIPKALEYYDKNTEKNAQFYNDIHHEEWTHSLNNNDMDRRLIKFYDKNKKLLSTYKYEVLGMYSFYTNVWQWAWSLPKLSKNENYISRKILNYGLNLDKDQEFLKMELITSKFRLSSTLQLDIHLALASYLSKIPKIYSFILNLDDPKEKREIFYLFLIEEV